VCVCVCVCVIYMYINQWYSKTVSSHVVPILRSAVYNGNFYLTELLFL